MTLETFFEKFDQFADAPSAVAKMRELVLQLAVQGKLSEQCDDDQNDSAWRQLAEELDGRKASTISWRSIRHLRFPTRGSG